MITYILVFAVAALAIAQLRNPWHKFWRGVDERIMVESAQKANALIRSMDNTRFIRIPSLLRGDNEQLMVIAIDERARDLTRVMGESERGDLIIAGTPAEDVPVDPEPIDKENSSALARANGIAARMMRKQGRDRLFASFEDVEGIEDGSFVMAFVRGTNNVREFEARLDAAGMTAGSFKGVTQRKPLVRAR